NSASLIQWLLSEDLYDCAVLVGRRLIELQPAGFEGYSLLATVHVASGDMASAVAVLNEGAAFMSEERVWDLCQAAGAAMLRPADRIESGIAAVEAAPSPLGASVVASLFATLAAREDKAAAESIRARVE